MTANVTSAGENKVSIEGFPGNWGANGRYDYTRADGACVLKSDHSRHALKWNCK